MKKITLGAVICAGLLFAGYAGAKVASMVETDWMYLPTTSGANTIHKVEDSKAGVICYAYEHAGISCVKK